MKKNRQYLILTVLIILLSSCAGFVADEYGEPQGERRPYSLRNGIEVWDDSLKFPFNRVRFMEEVVYSDGLNGKELEDKALYHAQSIKAQGVYIYKRARHSGNREVDVGVKRAELDVGGFKLEEHGVVPDTLLLGRSFKSEHRLFRIYVKFFCYQSP